MAFLKGAVFIVYAILALTLCQTDARVIREEIDSAGDVIVVMTSDNEGHDVRVRALTGETARMSLWAASAHGWLIGGACSESKLMAETVCQDLVAIPRSQVRVYAATGSDTDDKLLVTLVGAEGGRIIGPHDAVFVLDPYPNATFGHLVLLFFVAFKITEERCRLMEGLYLENGDCVQPAREPRCSPGPTSASGVAFGIGAPCPLLFLPLVTSAASGHAPALDLGGPSQYKDKLKCRTDIAGFSSTSCPELRPEAQVSQLQCDPVTTNTKRCDTTQFIKTRCSFMQTCDHAVLLSGGWNRQLSDYASLQRILDFHGFLKHNGFHDDNIKIFFANGMITEKDEDGDDLDSGMPAMFPSAIKLGLRNHVRRLCKTARCADTLLLYLNGPGLPGGATLLWDADSNGQFDETEVYSAREVLRDLSECGARRVIVIADQSFAGDLVRHAAQIYAKKELKNVVILAQSGSNNPWTERGAFTSLWTSPSASPKYRQGCFADLTKASELGSSQNHIFLGTNALLNVTVSGAPCGATHHPRRGHDLRHYQGCQNLSTREWMASQEDQDQEADDEELDQESNSGELSYTSENTATRRRPRL